MRRAHRRDPYLFNRRRWLLAAPICALAGLTACASATAPTPTPTQATTTAETETEEAAPGPTPTPTFAPLTEATRPIVLEPPVPTPTATLSPPPLHLPDSSIAIFRPGPGSQVTSPFEVLGHAGPSFNERARVRLIDLEGTPLDEQTTILFAYPGNPGRFASNLTFEFAGVSQVAILQVDTYDLRYNRLADRFSQEVVLLTTGSPLVRPGYQGATQLTITSPRENRRVQDGSITVTGGGWSTGRGPIVLQAIDRRGDVLDSTTVELSTSIPGRIGTFEGNLEFDLTFSQFGRLAIAEMDESIGGPWFYESIEVYFQR